MSEWRLAWRLARRELDWRFRGLRLLLACLFLGVGALATIGGLTAGIDRELKARGAVLLGGDVEFAVSGRTATPQERAAMAKLGAVSATVRMQASAVAGTTIVPVALKGVDGGYPLYGRLTLADGHTVGAPPPGTVWIDRALAERTDAHVGSPLRLGTATFRIGGVIADEPDRLGEGFTLGPVAILSLDGIARTGLVQPASFYESRYRVALRDGADPATAAARFTRAFPTAGWESKTRDRASPGAARFVDRMGQFLLLVGLSALAIAGIGIGNGVGHYLSARRESIATLKILGAPSALVARVYAVQIGLAALVGIAAALAAGVAAVPLIVALAGSALPVTPGFHVAIGPLVTAAAYGALIAVAFAAGPLAMAKRVPAASLLRGSVDGRGGRGGRSWLVSIPAVGAVLAIALLGSDRPGLTVGFLAAVAGTLALLALFGLLVRRTAAAFPRPRRPIPRLALAALHRPGARTATLVVALGLGLTLFVLIAAIRTSIDANIRRTVPARAPALIALDVPPEGEAEFRRIVAGVAPNATVKTVPAMRGTITGYAGTRVADLETLPEGAWALRGERGLTYAEDVPEGSRIVAGRWWPHGYAGPPLVSVDQRLAEALDLKIGDRLDYTLLGVERSARIASFRRIDWDTLGFNYVLVFSPNAIRDAPHNLAATIDLPERYEGRATRALLERFPSVSLLEVRGVLAQVRGIVAGMAAAIAAAASVTIFAGIAVLVGAVLATRETRVYDAAIFKTLGATRQQVLAAQGIEYAILSLAVAALALALGLSGAWYVVTRLFGFDWLPDWGTVGGTLGIGIAATVAIGLLGSLPALSARPARTLRAL